MDMDDQVFASMRQQESTYQLNQLTDVGNDAHLMVFVRYEGSLDLEDETFLALI